MGGRIRVLYVAGDSGDADRVAAGLEREDEHLSVAAAAGASRGLDRLSGTDPDCVVSDHDLPNTTGIDLFERLRERGRDVPFVLRLDGEDGSVASEAVSSGVTEYVRRPADGPRYDRLAMRIRSALTRHQSRRGGGGERPVEDVAASTDDVLWLVSRDWEDLLYVNEAYESVWGRSVDSLEADPRDMLNGVHPEDRDRLRAAMQPPSDGESVELECRVNPGAEFERWVQVQLEPVADGTDTVAGVAHDITERKEYEAKLQESKQRYRRLLETSPGPIAIYTIESELVYANEAAAEFLEADDPADLLGTTAGEFTHPESQEEVHRRRERLVEDREPVPPIEETLTTYDGETKYAIVSSTPVTWDGEPAIQTVLRDITERRERERQYRRERNRFVTLFENLPNPVVYGEMVDGEPIVRQVNSTFEETFGYDVDEAAGRNVDELTVPEGMREEAERVNERITAEGSARIEVERETKDGLRDFVIDIVLGDPDEETGAHEGYAIYTDITEQKERTEALRRKNERLDEFAGFVSHDLRNPLNTLQLSLEMAERTGDDEHFERAQRAANRMEQLLEDLLTLARQGKDIETLEQVDLAATVHGAWRTVRTDDADLQVETELTLRADRGRLQELLENLIRNAVEHGSTSPDSQARQDAGRAHSSEPSVADAPEDAVDHAGSEVCLTVGETADGNGFYVADDGPGIPPEERDDVFEAGYSTEADGTGLGLAIVEDIAEAHGWTVSIGDSSQGGARFDITGVDRPE